MDRLAGPAALGRERYDADVLVHLAIARLWITAGNYAEMHLAVAGIEAGVQPWSEMYGYRSILAHMLPEETSDDRVWFETVEGVARLFAALDHEPHDLA